MFRLYKLIESYVRVDRILHFLIGAWIVAQFEFLSLNYVLFAVLLVFILSIIKEFVDEQFDWYDILAGMIGALFQLGVFVIKFNLF